MYIKYLDIMNNKIDDVILQMYKTITLMFGTTKSNLDKMDISNIYACNVQIQLYIQELINNKFIKIGEINEVEKVEKEKSIFDEYDEENNYIDEEEKNEKTVFEMYKYSLFCMIKYAIKELKNSHGECMKCNLSEMLDYIAFDLQYKNEHKDDEINDNSEE